MIRFNLFHYLIKPSNGRGFAISECYRQLSVLTAYIRLRLCIYLLCPLLLTHLVSTAQEPTFGWAVSMDLGTTRTDFHIFSTAVDADGNVYMSGQFEGTNVDFDPGPNSYLMSSKGSQDILVMKLDSEGNFLWAKSYGSTDADVAFGIALDASGNVHITGRFASSVQFNPGQPDPATLTVAGGFDIFVLKLNTNGDFIWVKQMGGTGVDVANHIAVDAEGNVYTTGSFQSTADFDPGAGLYNLSSKGSVDIFVSKLNSNGDFIWCKSVGGTGNDTGYSIAVDLSGNVYATGWFVQTVDFDPGSGVSNLTASGGTNREIFVLKLDVNGNYAWARRMGKNSHDDGYAIAVDLSGNVYTTGLFQSSNVYFGSDTNLLSSAGAADIFVQKMDTNGNFVWAKSIGGTGSDLGTSITVDDWGNVYTTGYFNAGENIDFDPGNNIYPLTPKGGTDAFIQAMDSDGNFMWAVSMGGEGADAGHGVTVDRLGNVYTTGRFTGTVDFDPGSATFPLTASGTAAFIQKLRPATKLTATWNNGAGAISIEDGDELELVYGEQGELTFLHNNVDSPAPVFTFGQAPATDPLLSISGNSNTYTLTGIRINSSGEEGTLKITLPATSNFDAAELEFKVKVNRRAITVDPSPKTKQSGATEPNFTYTIPTGSLGIVSGHTATLSRAPGENVDSYPFTLSIEDTDGTDVSPNYDITISPAQFQVIGMPLTITPTTGLTKIYGSTDPAFVYAQPTGLPSGYSVTGALSREAGEQVGTYDFIVASLIVRDGSNNDVSSNYTITADPNATFSIHPAPLTITAVASEKHYGEEDPNLTYTVTGLVNEEQASVIFTGDVQRTPGEDVGVYPIMRHTLSLNSTNYTWNPDSFVSADFTIRKAAQQIDFTAFEEVRLNAGRLPLTVSSSSGLSVSLSVDNSSIANLSGTDLILQEGGTVTVTATQEGNHNYEPAPPVSLTIRIIAPEYNTLVNVNQAVSPNGDGVNDFLKIENIEKYPDNQLTIFDRAGNVVKKIIGYDNDTQTFTGMDTPDGTYFYRLGIKISGEWQYYQGFIVLKKN